jgi:hypothetical protein
MLDRVQIRMLIGFTRLEAKLECLDWILRLRLNRDER